MIHPTALVHAQSCLGKDVDIGPFCCVGPHVTLGDRVRLHSHVVVEGPTVLGEECEVFPFASVGVSPQHLAYKGEPSRLVIGKKNILREHVTVHRGTAEGGMLTEIGDDNLLMVGSHVAHDCRVGSHTILGHHVPLGGHVTVSDHAILGGMSAVHQFVRIGSYAMVAGGVMVLRDVFPFSILSRETGSIKGANLVGMRRHRFSKEEIGVVRHAFHLLLNHERLLEQRLEDLQNLQESCVPLDILRAFFKEPSKLGLALASHKENG